LGVVSGGWSDANGFSAPVSTIEVYSPALGKWSSRSNPSPRADFGMVSLKGFIYELGGEAKLASSTLFPQGESYPRSDVKRYTIGKPKKGGVNSNGKKNSPTLPRMPIACYRFATAASGASIFTFGGQCMPNGENITVTAFYALSGSAFILTL